MKKFKIAVAYEEGIAFSIKAKSKKEAEEKALHIVKEYGGAIREDEAKEHKVTTETVHRDYFIA